MNDALHKKKMLIWIGDLRRLREDMVKKMIRKAVICARETGFDLVLSILVSFGDLSSDDLGIMLDCGISDVIIMRILRDAEAGNEVKDMRRDPRYQPDQDYQIMDMMVLKELLCDLIDAESPDLIVFPSGRLEDDLCSLLAGIHNCGALTGCIDFHADPVIHADQAICADSARRGLQAVCLGADDQWHLHYALGEGLSIITIRNVEMEDVSSELFDETGSEPEPITLRSMICRNLPSGISAGIRKAGAGPVKKKTSITEAECIVAGGRGLGTPDKYRVLQDFAVLIGAACAVSRPLVDAGWIGKEYQVGLSGKTVSPRIYIACGISGAAHHTIGMSGSEWIMAVNIDRNEPIFDIADVGIIGDAEAILKCAMEKLAAE